MEAEALLARIERTALVVCVLMVIAAVAITKGRLIPGVAVACGGILASVSYRMIRASAGTIAGALPAPNAPGSVPDSPEAATRRAHPALIAATVTGRYALLALLAYVMIARLRLPLLGLLAGASSVVAAVSIEAGRFLLKKTP